MIPSKSSVIRYLDKTEIFNITSELLISDFWQNHPMKNNALHEGKSIIINWVTRINNMYQMQWNLFEHFPETIKTLKSVANDKQFGKIYWHRLQPGEQAKPHTDYRNPYIIDGKAYKRINIFLEIPNKVELYFDGDLDQKLDHSTFEFSIFDMAAIKVHAAKNFSNKNFYCLVCDILETNVDVYSDLYEITEKNPAGAYRLNP